MMILLFILLISCYGGVYPSTLTQTSLSPTLDTFFRGGGGIFAMKKQVQKTWWPCRRSLITLWCDPVSEWGRIWGKEFGKEVAFRDAFASKYQIYWLPIYRYKLQTDATNNLLLLRICILKHWIIGREAISTDQSVRPSLRRHIYLAQCIPLLRAFVYVKTLQMSTMALFSWASLSLGSPQRNCPLKQ